MNIQAIYPPVGDTLVGGCHNCGTDVFAHKGFVDLDLAPRRGWLCRRCACLSLPRAGMEVELLQAAQEKYRATGAKLYE